MLGEEEKFVNHEPKSELQGEGQKQTGHRDYSWVRPLHRGDCLIELKIAVFEGKEIRDFNNWPHNTGWPLNTKYYISVIS